VCMQIDPGQSAGLGSPAAAALMPGGGGGCDGLPAVNRAYNLFQPYDPVAYRLETNRERSARKNKEEKDSRLSPAINRAYNMCQP